MHIFPQLIEFPKHAVSEKMQVLVPAQEIGGCMYPREERKRGEMIEAAVVGFFSLVCFKVASSVPYWETHLSLY